MLKPSACQGCVLATRGYSFSKPDGLGTSGVLVVGEGLGHDEALDGLPFRPRAQAGSMLEQAFSLARVKRNQFKLWNMVACQPPGNELGGAWYEYEAISRCRRYFDRVAATMPQGRMCILALGNIPLKHLTGYSGVAKDKESNHYLRGYVLKSKYGPVVPSYHPSYLRRGAPELLPALVADIQKAMAVAAGTYTSYDWHPSYEQPDYNTAPGLDEVQNYCQYILDNPKLLLSYDIETPMSAEMDEDARGTEDKEEGYIEGGGVPIVSIQFSTAKGQGIFLPVEDVPEYLPYAKKILAAGNPKIGHNSRNFDDPILRGQGFTLGGPRHDVMWMFKCLHPELPRGLQSVASWVDFPFVWKHLFGKQFSFYGIADVDSLQWIIGPLVQRMKARGVWQGYLTEIHGAWPALEGMAKLGMPVDGGAWNQLDKDLRLQQAKVEAELQAMVPDGIKNIHPQRKNKKTGTVSYGYLKDPPQMKALELRYERGIRYLASKGKQIITFKDYLWQKAKMVQREFEEVHPISLETYKVSRYCILEPFKASFDQVSRYIQYMAGRVKPASLAKYYKVPRDSKGKENTRKDELKRLVDNTSDPVLERVLEIRSIGKMITNDIPNWAPKVDGCVHTTFYFSPPTDQLASRGPNIQNASKHTAIGQLFRRIIQAPPGRVLVEFDYACFHVKMFGREAEDPDYLRFAGLDPHSILTSWLVKDAIVGMDMEDGEILERCRYIKGKYKSVRDKQAKPGVLGDQLGLGPRKLYWANREWFNNEAEVKRMQDTLHEPFPKVARYKELIRMKAHAAGYLMNSWHMLREFYEVYRPGWNKYKGCWEDKPGLNYNDALSFPVQSNAHGMVRQKVKQTWQQGYGREYWLANNVHDSLVMIPEKSKLDKCIEAGYGIMQEPCMELANKVCPGGFSCKVGVTVGKNWANWHETKNLEGMREVKVG